MPRPRNAVPSYRLHKQSGQAVVTLPRPGGGRKDYTLGRHGSPESLQEYARLVAGYQPAPTAAPGPDVTVNEVLLAFWKHAEQYYRHPDGTPTGELANFRDSLRQVRDLFGHARAADFGPKALAAVRQRMVAAGLSRGVVNQRVGRVKRVFKWAAAEELVPAAVSHGLSTLAGLRVGRTEAREAAPVGPVAVGVFTDTLPFLPRLARAAAELQRVTGMRPGEVCRLRLAEVDRAGPVWVYRPSRHKTRHHGRGRAVLIGPLGQAVVRTYLAGLAPAGDDPVAGFDPAAFVFDAAREREARYAMMRRARRSKVPPSQASRKAAAPRRVPAAGYTPAAFAHAVRLAARKAGVPHWHPNQLRHLYATEVRKAYGLEAAQVTLGHAAADVTQVYAERDLTLAARVAAEVG